MSVGSAQAARDHPGRAPAPPAARCARVYGIDRWTRPGSGSARPDSSASCAACSPRQDSPRPAWKPSVSTRRSPAFSPPGRQTGSP